MIESFNAHMCLMLRDSKVASMDVKITETSLWVSNVNILNEALLPYSLRDDNNRLHEWLMSRLMPSNTRHYIAMMPIIFRNGACRRPFAQFILSLETNAVSLSDHYWLNAPNDITFDYEGRRINFHNKTWEDVNPWDRNVWSNDLDELLFNDRLFENPDDNLLAINNPIFTTCGLKQKKWDYDCGEWTLKKRVSTEDLEREIACLTFFRNKGILTPTYEVTNYMATNRYQFEPMTIRKGFKVIQKKYITSKEAQLTPLNWYIKENCEDSIHNVLGEISNAINIKERVLNYFESTIIEYLKCYNYTQIASSNFGFLINNNGDSIPAVWSNVGYTTNNQWMSTVNKLGNDLAV